MADLSVQVDGLRLPNPFVIASGPPSTNANVICKAFQDGWGAVIAKTALLDASTMVNVAPRYARRRVGVKPHETIVGWENIELITDRPFATWIDEYKQVKDRFPDRVLIASITEEYHKDRWFEIVERCQDAGVDGLELNFSCPHGLPERRMGSAIGQDPEMLREVCGWVNTAAKVPVWAKMTPNITSIEEPARAALLGGCEGVSAINTILCVMGVNLQTLRPEPTVEGYSTAGGYSGMAVRPIALRMVMECARLAQAEFGATPRSISGIGGIETGGDAAQFMLLGANTVQVCTGVMIHGYGLVKDLCRGLGAFMDQHGFTSVEQFRGRSLPFMTTHAELVRRQAEAKAMEAGANRGAVTKDTQWSGDTFVEQSSRLVSND